MIDKRMESFKPWWDSVNAELARTFKQAPASHDEAAKAFDAPPTAYQAALSVALDRSAAKRKAEDKA